MPYRYGEVPYSYQPSRTQNSYAWDTSPYFRSLNLARLRIRDPRQRLIACSTLTSLPVFTLKNAVATPSRQRRQRSKESCYQKQNT